MNPLLIAPIAELLGKGLDRLFPDPEQKARAQLELLKMQQDGEFRQVEQQLSVIIAEAQSADPWTSRARPSFLYVFYFILIFLIVIAPAIGVFFPDRMQVFFSNVQLGFSAIPEELWWTFGVGYLGYAGARTLEKSKRVPK